MSNVTVFAGGNVPAALKNLVPSNDLSDGVSGGFGVMSFRSSRWRVKYQKEEHLVTNSEGDPAASIDVVIIKANPRLAKNYYATGYSEGSDAAPDCFSMDSIRPDAAAPQKQSTSCASCSKNVFGSRITPAGKKAKACQDNRRLAIVPLNDLVNEIYGGPMLLRVPAASLADLASMGTKLKAQGFPYTAVAVRIGFDIDASFPKLTFKPFRPLTDAEAEVVATHLQSEKVDRILAEALDVVEELEVVEELDAPPPVPPKEQLFIQETAKPAAAKPAPAPVAKPAAAKPAAKPTPVVPTPDPDDVVVSAGGLDDDIRSILGGLDNLS